MPTIRTITTSLLLGMLLLPPHWCCAFPAESAEDDVAATQQHACCAIQRTASTATIGSPAETTRQPVRSCCAAHSGEASLPAAMPPLKADSECIAAAESGPTAAKCCAFCSPQVGAVRETVAAPLADAWLATPGILMPPLLFDRSAALVGYGANLPISGDTLALLCRWNC